MGVAGIIIYRWQIDDMEPFTHNRRDGAGEWVREKPQTNFGRTRSDIVNRFVGRDHILTGHLQQQRSYLSSHDYESQNATTKAHIDSGDMYGADHFANPPPPVTERIQSVQFEHTQNPDPDWGFVDRVTKSPIGILVQIPPEPHMNAYKNTVYMQLQRAERWLVARYHEASRSGGIREVTVQTASRKVRVQATLFMKHWTPQHLKPNLLLKYLGHVTDLLFDEIKDILQQHNIELHDVHGTFRSLAQRDSLQYAGGNQSHQHPWALDSKRNLHRTPHTQSTSIDNMKSHEATAQRYVTKSYMDLLDQHRLIINEVPQAQFESHSGDILKIGQLAVVDFFKFHKGVINASVYEQFLHDLNSMMSDELYSILVTAGVNLALYH